MMNARRLGLGSLAVVLLGSGCTMVDYYATHESIAATRTVFLRDAAGSVQKVEFKVTESGYAIGPDGKVFVNVPSQEVLASRYLK